MKCTSTIQPKQPQQPQSFTFETDGPAQSLLHILRTAFRHLVQSRSQETIMTDVSSSCTYHAVDRMLSEQTDPKELTLTIIKDHSLEASTNLH
jgi:hypothetical protein